MAKQALLTRDWLYEECAKLDSHTTLEAYFDQLQKVIDKLGFYQYLYTALPSFYEPHSGASPVMHTTYCQEWMQYYVDKNYEKHDSILRHCLSGSESIYYMHQAHRQRDLQAGERQVILDAAQAGIDSGIALPMYNTFGGAGLLTLTARGGEREFSKLFNSCRDSLEIFARSFNESILRHFSSQFCPADVPQLTPREREVLMWLASGMTYDEIADKLAIGVSTTRKHVANVIRKFKARNSTHACALAAKWGLLY